jgi:hypothetical protein
MGVTTMGSNNKNKKNNGRPKWPDRYLKEMETLRREIAEKEKEGVNVTRAWRLFGIARKLDREEDVEKAFDYIEKVRGDLVWKDKLFKWSTRKGVIVFACSVPFLIAGPLAAYLIAKYFGYDIIQCKPVWLRMPVFILAWGYLGSAAYVLITISNRLSKKLFDPRDMLFYAYRLLLGGILAGAIFYVMQMGLVSIPGTAGEEVNAALLRTATVSKYRNLDTKRQEINKVIGDKETIIKNFERGYIEHKIKFETDETSKADIGEPVKNGKSRTQRLILTDYIVQREKAELLITYKDEWERENLEYYSLNDGSSEAEKASKSSNINDYYKGKITPAKINRAITESNYGYIEYCYSLIKGTVVSKLIKEINEDTVSRIRINQEIGNLKPAIDSEIINKEIIEINMEKEALDKSRIICTKVIDANESTKPALKDIKEPEPENNDKPKEFEPQRGKRHEEEEDYTGLSDEVLYKRIGVLDKKIGEIEEKKRELKDKLKAAKKREEESPVWESAVFIVIAFFSGYSINFVTKMFDRAMTAIISGKPGATEMEGEVPHEPEAGGEEGVG